MIPFSLLRQQFFPSRSAHSQSLRLACSFDDCRLVLLVILISFHVVANLATSFIASVGQFVSALTMCFMCILSAWASTAKYVIPRWPKFQVCGITASTVIANNVVQARDVSAYPAWQRFNKPCVHKTVCRNLFAFVVSFAISGRAQATSPIPATCSLVNIDLGKQLRDSFSWKIGYCEKLVIRHVGLRSRLKVLRAVVALKRFDSPTIIL